MPAEYLTRVAAGPARDELLPLLRLADDSDAQVRSYYQAGELFALRGEDQKIRGITLAILTLPGVFELKSVAVVPELQRRGVGRRMLARVLDELRDAGARLVKVGTGNSSIGEIAFYQKSGFRLSSIERNFFVETRGYPQGLEEDGIPLRDLVWLDRQL